MLTGAEDTLVKFVKAELSFGGLNQLVTAPRSVLICMDFILGHIVDMCLALLNDELWSSPPIIRNSSPSTIS